MKAEAIYRDLGGMAVNATAIGGAVDNRSVAGFRGNEYYAWGRTTFQYAGVIARATISDHMDRSATIGRSKIIRRFFDAFRSKLKTSVAVAQHHQLI